MAALEDCYTVLKWMHTNASEVNLNPHKLAYGGGSAGGSLAASLGLLVRDRKELRPIFQVSSDNTLQDIPYISFS